MRDDVLVQYILTGPNCTLAKLKNSNHCPMSRYNSDSQLVMYREAWGLHGVKLEELSAGRGRSRRCIFGTIAHSNTVMLITYCLRGLTAQ